MAADWAGMAEAYDASFGRLCGGAVPFLLDRVSAAQQGGSALDVGTGTGTVAAALAAEGFETLGADADPGMVERAASKHPTASFEVAALPHLPFLTGRFGLTTANFVVNHVPDPRAAASELIRVTSPGGIVIVTIWPSEPISPLNDLWNHVVVTSGAVPLSGHRLPPEKDFSRNVTGLRELLAYAGGLESAADEVSWTFRIDAEDLWLAVEAGIATIGATYRQQNHAGRHAMRAAYEESTGLGGLEFVSTAVIASARVA